MIRKVDVENGAPKIKDEVSKCLHCSDNHNKITTISFIYYCIVVVIAVISVVISAVIFISIIVVAVSVLISIIITLLVRMAKHIMHWNPPFSFQFEIHFVKALILNGSNTFCMGRLQPFT